MNKITGQVVYVGPHVQDLGLSYGAIFRNGIYEHFYRVIEACPSLGGLFVPIASLSAARKELDFDFGRRMRGTKGRYVTFYREVQKWLRESRQAVKPSPSGVTIEEE